MDGLVRGDWFFFNSFFTHRAIDAAVWRASNSTFPKLLSKNWARKMMKTFEFEVISTILEFNHKIWWSGSRIDAFLMVFELIDAPLWGASNAASPKKKCQKSNEKILELVKTNNFFIMSHSRRTFFFRKNPSTSACSPQRELSNGATIMENGIMDLRIRPVEIGP